MAALVALGLACGIAETTAEEPHRRPVALAPPPAHPPDPAELARRAAAAAASRGAARPPIYSSDPRTAARQIVPPDQFPCFDWVITHESDWYPYATNPSSGAYGLGQALPPEKMASEAADWRTNPITQIKWTLEYMDERYGSPCLAQAFWVLNGWY